MQQNVWVWCRTGRSENVRMFMECGFKIWIKVFQAFEKVFQAKGKAFNYFLSVHQEFVHAHKCMGLSLFLRNSVSKDYEKCNLNFENHLVMVVDNSIEEMLVLNSWIRYIDKMTNQDGN